MPYADPYGSTTSSGSGATPPLPGGGDYPTYYLNNTPEAGFWYYLQKHGLVGNQPNQQYAQGQYNRTMGKYMANAADNPVKCFYDYLIENGTDFNADFAAQTPDQRGDATSRTLAGRARFMKAY